VYYCRATSFLRFGEAKRGNAKYIRKEMFPVYGEKYLSRKAVQNRVQNVTDDARPFAEVAETTLKRLLYAVGFDALVEDGV
jgi:hypothetical protein